VKTFDLRRNFVPFRQNMKSLKNRLLSTVLVLSILLQISFPIIVRAEGTNAESSGLVSQGIREFGNSFKGVGTPSWILQKFGIEMGYHLIDCATNKEKPDVVKVVKSMATADYLSRTAGGLLGGAAGSVFIPFLSAVPVFGGFLADFVPTFTYYLGADLGGSGLKGLKEGKFSFKNYFKKLDWTAMFAGSLGWSMGSLLCSAILPPIGGIVGGMIGDLVATKLLDKIRQWRGKSDSSPPLTPTGTGGPIRTVTNQPQKGSYASAASVSTDSLISGRIDTDNKTEIMALSKEYESLYEKYNRLVADGNGAEALKISQRLNVIKAKIEDARKR
jgi:hypothetical protein